MGIERKTTLNIHQRLAYAFLGPVLLASSIGPALPPPITPDKDPTPQPVPTAMATAVPEQSQLEIYLEKIKPIQDAYIQIVREHDVFAGLKPFPADKRVEDTEMYFPIYYAVWQEYPLANPYLASIFHVDESSNSRDEHPDWYPYPRSGSSRGMIKGAVQRYDLFYKDELLQKIIKGYEWLENYKGQRYTKTEGFPTNDFEELFFLGWKLSRDAKEHKDKMRGNGILISDNEALAKAMEMYSRADIGRNRFRVYQANKHLFTELFPIPGNP